MEQDNEHRIHKDDGHERHNDGLEIENQDGRANLNKGLGVIEL
jgi:hypothetical protein